MADPFADLLGAALGVFPRAFVERHNLLHCAVGILVRNAAGDVYVHQRAPTKSVHPSMYDMFVGGLVVAGEAVETASGPSLPYGLKEPPPPGLGKPC